MLMGRQFLHNNLAHGATARLEDLHRHSEGERVKRRWEIKESERKEKGEERRQGGRREMRRGREMRKEGRDEEGGKR